MISGKQAGFTFATVIFVGVLGVSAPQAEGKGYSHCVKDGKATRGCTNGTWWQDGKTKKVYDRAYWRYVSGPNSVYHVTYFEQQPGEDFSKRSANTKSKVNKTARYEFTPRAGNWLTPKPGWKVSADICEDEYLSPDNCRRGGESLSHNWVP